MRRIDYRHEGDFVTRRRKLLIGISLPTPSAIQILKQTFGYDVFRGAQEEIITHVSDGGDALVLMPTGGGKSLCYQIPALMRPGAAIVISPLIALMQDQVDALHQYGVNCTFINSSISYEEADNRLFKMKNGDYDLVYVAPERLMMPRFLALLKQTPIALFAIDEAHCVSQWGHDFRPEYMQLATLKANFPETPLIALTATADTPTRNEIITRLNLGDARIFSTSFNRPNIHYHVVAKNASQQQLLEFIGHNHPNDAGIVYCLSRKRVEKIAALLKKNGFRAHPYHAGLSADERQKNQRNFVQNEGIIIVATIAFGMGIDKPDVRFVAHLDMPKSIEGYYQETGRAGRDGQPANAWAVYGLSDVVLLRQMIQSSTADESIKRSDYHKLMAMLGYCETTSCRRQTLLRYFGETHTGNCQNCDTCLEPVEDCDGSIVAQKAMSCVFRTGQRFGVTHLVDILRGKSTRRVEEFQHQHLSTFGIGSDVDGLQWRSIFRQLVAGGFLDVDIEGYGALLLTATSRAVLQGQKNVTFRKDWQRSRDKKRGKKSTAIKQGLISENPHLYEALRDMRTTLSKDQGIPAYMIFSNATLTDIVAKQPTSPDALMTVSGIGESKIKRYGKAILDVVREAT